MGGSNVGVSTWVPESRRLSSETDLIDLGVAGAWRGSLERYDRTDWKEWELELDAESGTKLKPSMDDAPEGTG